MRLRIMMDVLFLLGSICLLTATVLGFLRDLGKL